MIHMMKKYRGEIKVVGIRPGEKLYEELMTTDEIERSYENDKCISFHHTIMLLTNCTKIMKN